MQPGNPFPFVLLDGLLNGGGAGGGDGDENVVFMPFMPGMPMGGGGRGRGRGRGGRGGGGGEPDNSGVGHLYDATVPPREWIRREQQRVDEGMVREGAEEGSDSDGSRAAALSAQARERGNQAYARNAFDDALAHYTEALRHMPDEKAYANRSLIHYKEGRFQAALEDAQKAVQLAPNWYRGHIRVANAHFSLGNYDESELAAREAARFAVSDEDREAALKITIKCEAKKMRAPPQPPSTPQAPGSPSDANVPQFPSTTGGGPGTSSTTGGGAGGTFTSNDSISPQMPGSTPLTPGATFFGGAWQEEPVEALGTDLSPLKERRLRLRSELEKSELVTVADKFTRTRCAKEVKSLLNEVDPDLLAAAQYAASTSQEELRKAADSGDRTAYENALTVRDKALETVWNKARQGLAAITRANKLAVEEEDAVKTLKDAIDKIEIPSFPPQPGDTASAQITVPLSTTTTIAGGSEEGDDMPPPSAQTTEQNLGERTTSDMGPASTNNLHDLSDLIKKHRSLRQRLQEDLQPAMTKVDEALVNLAKAKAEEDAQFARADELFHDLRSTSDSIVRIMSALKGTESCLSANQRRLSTLAELKPTFESLLHDESSFKREVEEGNTLLEEEAHLERDRLKWEKQRIQSHAELEWSKVKEDLPTKIEHLQKEVESAASRVRLIVQRQGDVRDRLREMMAKDHPELAWKATAAGSSMMKTIKGTGMWVNESFSDFTVHSVVSAPASGSKVYRATSRVRGTEVALKEIPIETERDKKHFLAEVSVSVAVSHGAICPVLGVFFDGPFGYIIMPYYALGNAMKYLSESSTNWSWWKVQELFRQIVSGVAHLHEKGVMHHDLKPTNVLMKDSSTALLADFGLSRDLGRFGRKADVTVTSVRGTPDYTPPELLSAKEGDQVSALRADMWSLGATLYTLASINSKKEDLVGAEGAPSIGQLQAAEGKVVIQPGWVGGSERLASLLTSLLDNDPAQRPLTQAVLAHPYFTVSLLKDLVDNHQLIESNSKVEAFRTYAHEVTSRTANRHPTMMSVVRSRMVDSVTSVLPQIAANADELLGPFFVVFRGEEGIDEGGLSAEMFHCYFQQLITKAKALIHSGSTDSDREDSLRDADGGFNSSAHYLPSSDINIPTAVFKTMGMMMLKSLVDNRSLPMQLSTAVLKYLVGGIPNLTDLEEFDKVMVRNLRRLLLMGEDELEMMSLDFSEFDRDFLLSFEGGSIKPDDLVTRENVALYVSAKVQWELVGKRERALRAIKEGFFSSRTLQPHLQLLSATELQLLLCGQQHVNAEDVIALLEFSQFPAGSQTPSQLKDLLRSFSQSNLRRFLRLCTSSVSLPRTPAPAGPPQNRGGRTSAPIKIKVLCTQDRNRLPVGHSCAYQLDLPDYGNPQMLREKLGIALAHANDGFNIV